MPVTETVPLTFYLLAKRPARFVAVYQFAVEIKRSSGVGTTSVALNSITVKTHGTRQRPF
jgi:hypothetical protein